MAYDAIFRSYTFNIMHPNKQSSAVVYFSDTFTLYLPNSRLRIVLSAVVGRGWIAPMVGSDGAELKSSREMNALFN